ncbi:MAG: hypothetical protein HY556_11495 [Euryarchaeota archaeon]|nr:hypothetical protein [Euryarchaeota archaeon]
MMKAREPPTPEGPPDIGDAVESQIAVEIIKRVEQRDAETVGAHRGVAALSSIPRHETAEPRSWPWLPTVDDNHLAPHPFCAHCGFVKYVGSYRALPLGGLVNLASALAERAREMGRTVTQTQMRLIIKRLQSGGANDTFTLSKPVQERLLIDAFAACTGLGKPWLENLLRSC